MDTNKHFQTLIQIIAIPFCFAIIWTVVSPLYHLPSLWKIMQAVLEMIQRGTYVHDILISSIRAVLGFSIGYGLGSILGVLTGRYRSLFLVFGGLFLFLRWTPVLAILPLTIRIGGLGEGPKIFLISWACFFISWIYTHVAVTKLDQSYVWWGESLGLNVRQKFFRLYIPAISPALIGAARASLAIAMIVVVAAELSGTLQSGFFRDGLGYRLWRAVETNRNDMNIACILTFGLLGVTYDFLFIQFVKKVLSRITRIDFYRNEGL